jgi:hypothetical protein
VPRNVFVDVLGNCTIIVVGPGMTVFEAQLPYRSRQIEVDGGDVVGPIKRELGFSIVLCFRPWSFLWDNDDRRRLICSG